MFEKSFDVFIKDGFKIIKLPEKHEINDLKKEGCSFDENTEEERENLKLNIKLENGDVSNNVKDKNDDAENENEEKNERRENGWALSGDTTV